MEKWELAKADRDAGMTYQQIADKYKVSVNTVKSWASRKWKKESAAAGGAEGLQPSPGLQPSDMQPQPEQPAPARGRGAPPGNKNAVGNRGGRGGPPGNTNAMKHGAFTRKKYAGLLDDEMLDSILAAQADDPLALLGQKIDDLLIQEAYYLQRIRELRMRYAGGMGVHDATKQIGKKAGAKDNDTETVTTRTLALDELLHPLYVELNKVQRLLVATIREKESIEINRRRVELAERKLPPVKEETPEDTAMMGLSDEELRALVKLGGALGEE